MSATALPGASPPSGPSAFISHNGPHPQQKVQRFRVQFTASGRVYFRIWLRDLLLTLVTAGLYLPWAEARKLRYFRGHTLVASHALAFHGEPRKMLRGHLLTVALLLSCLGASQVSPAAGIGAAVLMGASLPALFQARARFRLANTSWRGARFGFTGRLQDCYAAFLLPLLAAACLVLLGEALLPALLGILGHGGPAVQALIGALMCMGLAAVLPFAYWRIKCLQHHHRVYPRLSSEFGVQFRVRYRDVLKLFLDTALVASLSSVIALALGAVAFALGLWARPPSIHPQSTAEAAQQALPMWLGLLGLAQIIPFVYFKTAAQNLVWTSTGNRWLRFKSEMAFRPLLQLTIQNWALITLTLGLYWPFASVTMTRMRLQAVCVHMRTSPDLLVNQPKPGGHP